MYNALAVMRLVGIALMVRMITAVNK